MFGPWMSIIGMCKRPMKNAIPGDLGLMTVLYANLSAKDRYFEDGLAEWLENSNLTTAVGGWGGFPSYHMNPIFTFPSVRKVAYNRFLEYEKDEEDAFKPLERISLSP
ncbi:hypothetical protein N7508_010042 [Penicillium antarcticum]|uniref:uncharacterized protein n=1 Tax=Penicillium antarcticum TaxID=416450 RepID=UPI002386FA9E|nr:uncharacterized protein N7508_010042 [Penicillium antarcticum]KAJ5295221.1 hypothetical protein N7508_010042 [Penicillium antarcticum]